MQFLSVAARELRVASRKRGSFRLRMLTSAVAFCVSGFSLWIDTLLGSTAVSGEELFSRLTRVAFLCASVIGPALTADSVSEERNEGTLGLLFLTHLRGASISFGKLVGHGLLAFYSVISIVPVVALAVILGGADAESLSKTALVLLVTLALSLISGMFASTVCRKAWVAGGVALLFLAVLDLGIPLAVEVLRLNQWIKWSSSLELLSPTYALSMASPSAAMLTNNNLGAALGVQSFMAVALFGTTTFLLSRVWKEGKSGAQVHPLYARWKALRYGSGEARRKLRLLLLRINPILWLSSRERYGATSFAVLLLLLACAISWAGQQLPLGPAPNDDFLRGMVAWIFGIPLLYLLFCFRFAAAASERFAVDRKVGALELIACTPLKTRQIISGHWLGLFRRFWGAALLLLALHAFALYYIMEAIRLEARFRRFDLRDVVLAAWRHISGGPFIPNDLAPFYIACLAVLTAAILIVILWIALGWLAMALSLKLHREILAPWVSLFLLAVPPFPLFVCSVALLDNKKLFAANLFLAMLRLGSSGFFIVLANALLWLFIARRWTYRNLRPSACCGS